VEFYTHPEKIQISPAQRLEITSSDDVIWTQNIVINEGEYRGTNTVVLMHSTQATILPPFEMTEEASSEAPPEAPPEQLEFQFTPIGRFLLGGV